MKKLLPLLTHPVVLSLSVTVVIILLFFPSVPKYRLQIKEQIAKKADNIEFWDDLDGNKYSDRIFFVRPDVGRYKRRQHKRSYYQWIRKSKL